MKETNKEPLLDSLDLPVDINESLNISKQLHEFGGTTSDGINSPEFNHVGNIETNGLPTDMVFPISGTRTTSEGVAPSIASQVTLDENKRINPNAVHVKKYRIYVRETKYVEEKEEKKNDNV